MDPDDERTFLSYQALTASRQADHDDAYPGAFCLYSTAVSLAIRTLRYNRLLDGNSSQVRSGYRFAILGVRRGVSRHGSMYLGRCTVCPEWLSKTTEVSAR